MIYPSEFEISLKGGLLPHYLIGYLSQNRGLEDEIEINPNFLDLSINSSDWIKDGLPIDQSGFLDVLKKTNYTGSFWVNTIGDYGNEQIQC